MKRVFHLFFALSLSIAPAFAWGWGEEGGCPYSKKKSIQDVQNEQVEKVETSID